MQLKDKELFIQKGYINGEWVGSLNKNTFDVFNPSDLSKIGTMPNMSKEDTILAIKAANDSWEKKSIIYPKTLALIFN